MHVLLTATAGTCRGQQSLFSWAEFLAEEPAQPQGQNGIPKLSSLSLFEWALSAEQGAPRHAA